MKLFDVYFEEYIAKVPRREMLESKIVNRNICTAIRARGT